MRTMPFRVKENAPVTESKKPYVLESVERALLILESFHPEGLEFGVIELSRKLQLSPSVVHRLLTSLQNRGFVQQNAATKKYRLSVKVFEIGSLAINHSLREAALPWLEELMRETGASVHLSILDGNDIVYVERVNSPKPIQIRTPIGGRAPAHCSATGKAILAFEAPSVLDGVLAAGLYAYTSASVTDANALRAELEAIRRRGYSISAGEWRGEIAAIGAPVMGYTRKVVAGLGLSLPISDFSEADGHRLGRIVVSKAAGVSASLGYTGVYQEARS